MRTKTMISPATDAAVRQGILLYLQRNMAGLAAKLRWGYSPYQEAATQAGLTPQAHRAIVASLNFLQNQYTQLGGTANTMRYVILSGQGNVDQAVAPLSNDPMGLEASIINDGDWLTVTSLSPMSLAGADDAAAAPESPVLALIKLALPILLDLLKGLDKYKSPTGPLPAQYAAEQYQTGTSTLNPGSLPYEPAAVDPTRSYAALPGQAVPAPAKDSTTNVLLIGGAIAVVGLLLLNKSGGAAASSPAPAPGLSGVKRTRKHLRETV